MSKTTKVLFAGAVLWEAAAVLWFKNPFRHDFSRIGWICIALGILCTVGGVIANRIR